MMPTAKPSSYHTSSFYDDTSSASAHPVRHGPPAARLQRAATFCLTWVLLAAVLTSSLLPAGIRKQSQVPATVPDNPPAQMRASAPASQTPGGPQVISASQPKIEPDRASNAQNTSSDQGLTSAFVSDHALADGSRQALVSSTPLNYKASDGTWQPIDPRFKKAVGGFTNFTNLLQVSAGTRQAVIHLKYQGNMLGWEPRSLSLERPDGTTTPIAQPLEAQSSPTGTLTANRTAIVYQGGWSLADIQEQVSSAAGQAEQELIFQKLPKPAADEKSNSAISLNATLHMLSGYSLYLAGKVQKAEFTASGPVEIRDSAGKSAITLAPPYAYEKDNPSQRVAGSYRFTPQGDGQWQVAVETPLSWWQAAKRNYPVVLDPIMEVILPSVSKTIAEHPQRQRCFYDSYDPNHELYIGKDFEDIECGRLRALVTFGSLPRLPVGYTIREADLIVAPADISDNQSSLKKGPYYAYVYPVTSTWDSSVDWSSQPTVGAALDLKPLLVVYTQLSPGVTATKSFYATKFVLQSGSSGIVSDWLKGKSPNYGIELREAGEGKNDCTYKNPKRNIAGCLQIGTPNNIGLADWTSGDQKQFQNPQTLPTGPWYITQSSGVALLIQYTPPTLQEGTPYPLTPLSPLPSSGDVFAFTNHQYRLPSINSTWTAVSVKGLHKNVVSGSITQLQATGNLGITKVCSDGTSNCQTKTSQGNFPAQPNYFLVHGNPANYHMQAQVAHANSSDPANANLDSYIVEADSSRPLGASNPQLNANTIVTYTYQISTSHILKVFNLNLVDNTRVAVKVDATAVHPITKGIVPFPVESYAFKPVSNGSVAVKNNGILLDGRDAGGKTLNGTKLKIGSGQGGTWALVVANRSDFDPTFDDPISLSTQPVNETVQVVVHACALNAIPTHSGCQVVQYPDSSTPYVDVGPYRVFSQAGFSPSNCSTTCYTLSHKGSSQYAPLIFWRGGATDRAVAVAEDTLNLNPSYGTLYSQNGELWLEHFPGSSSSPDYMLDVARGYYSNDTTTNLLVPSGLEVYPGLPLDESDAAQATINIDVQLEKANGDVSLTRKVESTPGTLTTFNFDLSWSIYAEGYAFVSPTISQTGGPSQVTAASLELRFGPSWGVDLDPSFAPNGRFTNLRNYGKIVQPDSMGGAWQNIQALILPNGVNLPGIDPNGSPCNGNCLDLRAMDDTLNQPDRNWKMPDVLVTGAAQTVMLSKPGDLTIFSSDQPHASNATTVPFSFSTFEGDVTVKKEVCPGSSNKNKVTVISGSTKIALPGLGSDTGMSKPISADFILCETALREASLTFNSPPEIPVGSTGLLVNMISGKVVIGPSNTRVTISVGYHDSGDVVTGKATVILDTAGLFDIQATGKVVAQVDYSGHAWVAWNPLDVGVDVSASYHSWLTGQVHAHLWKGQGWQHRYNWLPDDSQTHFAGSIAAQIHISEGQAFSWWFIDIPPFDTTFGIEVAFGQFCANSSCSSYEWGVKGKFTVVGYDVGVYYGFDSGFDFILGSDSHVLIDQYHSTSQPDTGLATANNLLSTPMSNGKPLAVQRRYVPDPSAPEVTEPLTVTANTGSFLAGLSWERGAPQLSLVRPDAVVITPSNAASHGVVISDTLQYRLYGVQNPMPGIWQAKISNATSNDNYHVLFLANKQPPTIQFQAPTTTQTLSSNENPYTIRWTPPSNLPSGVDLRVSLYYTVTAGTALTTTQQYGGVIRENLPISQGQYDWDLSYLAKGTYHVYARVYSGQAGNSAIQPKPTNFGTDQVPGYQKVIAPGTIVLDDQTGPSIPNPWTVTLTPLNDAFLACWKPLAAHDLSGYTILYTRPDVDGVLRTIEFSIPATVPYSTASNAPKECTRIGGLNDYNQVSLIVAGYDSSGNYSNPSSNVNGMPTSTQPDGPPAPGVLSGTVGSSYTVHLQWSGAGPLSTGDGYRLYYAQEATAGPGQSGTGATEGDAPIDVGNTTSTTLHGLAPGYFYHFIVQTYYGDGRLSPFSNEVILLLTNGADKDNDGMPDDWEKAHNVSSPNADPDGDGLTNIQEFQHGTNPHLWDTDGDGFSDGDEVSAGSDPLDPNSTPLDPGNAPGYVSPADLTLDKDHLIFYDYALSVPPLAQTVQISNSGEGNLVPSARTKSTWIKIYLINGNLHVGVDPKGLSSPGHYQGKITVSGAPGSMTQHSPQTVKVDLWLMTGSNPHQMMYLPVMDKQH
jgi:hypothetical protein